MIARTKAKIIRLSTAPVPAADDESLKATVVQTKIVEIQREDEDENPEAIQAIAKTAEKLNETVVQIQRTLQKRSGFAVEALAKDLAKRRKADDSERPTNEQELERELELQSERGLKEMNDTFNGMIAKSVALKRTIEGMRKQIEERRQASS